MPQATPPITPRPAAAKKEAIPLFPSNFELINSHSNWSDSWTHILAGNFLGDDFSGLFFYDQRSGAGEI